MRQEHLESRLITDRKKIGSCGFETVILEPRPEHRVSRMPVIVVPGWGNCELEHYKHPLITIAERRTVIGFSAVHGVSVYEDLLPESLEIFRGFSEVHLRKAFALLLALEKNGVEKTDAVAYSEGGITVALAATLFPELFRHIVFFNSAGMTGKKDLQHFFVNYMKEVGRGAKEALFHGTFLEKTFKAIRGPVKGVSVRPNKALHEIYAVSQTELASTLQSLRKKGIRFSAAISKEDLLFTPDDFYLHTPRGLFHEVREVEGGHSNFLYGKAGVAEELLTNLEKKR